MATRHWTLHFDGETHTVRLEHGYWLGLRQIWVDDKLLEKSRRLIDSGSQHVVKIGEHTCEIGITNSGFTYGHYLLVDGELVPAQEDARKNKRRNRVRSGSVDERLYWQALAQYTELRVLPVQGKSGNSRYSRLVGWRNGHVIAIQPAFLENRKMCVKVGVTFGSGTDIQAAYAQIEADTSVAHLIQDKKAKAVFGIHGRQAWIALKYDPDAVNADVLGSQIQVFIRAVFQWTRPQLLPTCDFNNCRHLSSEVTTLVFIDGDPYLICTPCVKELPQLGEKMRKRYKTMPSGIEKMAAVSLLVALVYAVLGGGLGALLETVIGRDMAAFCVVGACGAHLWVIDKTLHKFTLAATIISFAIVILSLVLTVYVYSVLAYVQQHAGINLFMALTVMSLRWLQDGSLFFDLVYIAMLIAGVYLMSFLFVYGLKLKHSFNPLVEVVGDINVLNEMNR